MKIVTKAALMQQPIGTLFADYKSGGRIGEISTYAGKQPNGIHFYRTALGLRYMQLPEGVSDWTSHWLYHMEKGGEGVPDFNSTGRDSMFDENAQYVLLDKEDVTLLLKHVAKSLTQAYGVANPADLV